MILNLEILIFTFVSAYMDLKWWKVKNEWLLFGLAAGVITHFLQESPGFVSGLLGMIIPFALLIGLYACRKIGAGDIKMFMVTGFMLGHETILPFMLGAMICGAVWFAFLAVRAHNIRLVLKVRVHVAVCAFVSALCWIGGIYG